MTKEKKEMRKMEKKSGIYEDEFVPSPNGAERRNEKEEDEALRQEYIRRETVLNNKRRVIEERYSEKGFEKTGLEKSNRAIESEIKRKGI